MTTHRLAAAVLACTFAAGIAFAAEPATQPAKAYPLKNCVVSGEELGGDMGEPVVITYKGQEVKFCCHSCVAKFNADPDTYMKKIAEAEKAPTTKPAK